jgi:hypothetical protein
MSVLNRQECAGEIAEQLLHLSWIYSSYFLLCMSHVKKTKEVQSRILLFGMPSVLLEMIWNFLRHKFLQ